MGASHQDARKGHTYYGRVYMVRVAYARKRRTVYFCYTRKRRNCHTCPSIVGALLVRALVTYTPVTRSTTWLAYTHAFSGWNMLDQVASGRPTYTEELIIYPGACRAAACLRLGTRRSQGSRAHERAISLIYVAWPLPLFLSLYFQNLQPGVCTYEP